MVIISSGCAGLAAAVHAGRANLQPLVIGGLEAGGRLALGTLVENFPGFPKGVQAHELIENMQKQAAEFGAEFMEGNVRRAALSSCPFTVEVDQERIETRTLIMASGASAKLLGLESERKLLGRGVSTCAASDGVFIGIGHSPNTALFQGQLGVDDLGYVRTHHGTKTSVPAVYAAGDVQNRV